MSSTNRRRGAGKPLGRDQAGIDRRRLAIYLNDHLAGATMGVELSRRTASENEASGLGPQLERLSREIQEDRQTLLGLMEQLRIPVRAWKSGTAWVVEKLSRAKLNGQVTGYSPLSRLIELESLALGVRGKAAMWRALDEWADLVPSLDSSRLRSLLDRAEDQLETLEELRVWAAAEAFVPAES
jgi:hypothetical protein